MIGAIEFLRKAKVICKSFKECAGTCPLTEYCENTFAVMDEAELVRRVMDYQIKVEKDLCSSRKAMGCD